MQINMADMGSKGRRVGICIGDSNGSRMHPETRQGEKNGRAKVTEDIVREIRRRYVPGLRYPHTNSAKALADEFGVSCKSIPVIASGKTWGHV